MIEVNDTLQLTREQGFPLELDIEQHLKSPLKAEAFAERIFEFSNKPSIRIYHAPPVRTFLVENRDGKWIYWGRVFILSVTHHLESNTTSGTYKIVSLYSPEEMQQAFQLIDLRPEMDFFTSSNT